MRVPRDARPLPGSKLIYALAAIPFIDCIVNQVYNALHISFGGLSLLQLVRGYMLVVLLGISLWTLLKDYARVRRIPLPGAVAFLLIGLVVTNELVVTGSLALASIAAYGQLSYWVMFWITVSLRCRTAKDAEIILYGLAVGALATAFSVMLGFAFGGVNYYEDDAVSSSAGWFNTAKMITGVLVTGGVVLLYLGRRKPGWTYPLLASFCFVACILTYARAGSVALAVVLVWLLLWTLCFGRNGERRWTARFLILAVSAGLVMPAVVGTDKLFARWNDFGDSDKAGSGRAAFWKVAVNGYVNGTPDQQAFGYGFSAMSDMLFLDYGADIKHTHNDMLDMMLVGGVPGACWLLLLLGSLFWHIRNNSVRSVEGGAGLAILLAFVVHGQFTGQIWGTDAMTYYMLSLTSLYTIGRCVSPSDASPINTLFHVPAPSIAHA